ncbi:MAG TPA: aminodeoxychorismate synthase component I [Chthoniobacteraceae bacterium]|nr:aminodeoxychorismate synthase component I [Chthoniobacteraceae bacterium]
MAISPPIASCSLTLSPVEVAARLADRPGLVFLDSALESPRPRLSLVAARPSKLLRGRTAGDWEALAAELSARQVSPSAAFPSGWPAGFAAGWAEYDGAFCFGFYDSLLLYRHPEKERPGQWHAIGPEAAALAAEVARLPAPPTPAPPEGLFFRHEMSREGYIERVVRAQQFIAQGDIYQVNLTHRLASPWPAAAGPQEAFALYRALRHASPAPYGAYLRFPQRTILSSSPELFLQISGRRIRTRPIKGTRPRKADPAADRQSAEELLASPKERSELIMITDLERNDLGQICEYGSVTVPGMLQLETYEQIFHLVSTIEGVLRPEIGAVEAFRRCFPGGSITGAPKKRAMEIIAELEPTPRGPYTGAIGYFGFNGESQFNITIRTLFLEKGEAHFHVGAGIVADSIPPQEWQETLDKAAGILKAARQRPM